MTITIIVIGAVAASTGIVRGNIAGNQIWDAMNKKAEAERGMFSTGDVIDSGSIQGKRYDAIQKYRAEQPDGSKLKSLRTGQLLTVVGMLVVVIGFFI